MMTSVGSERNRGTRDKTQLSTTQPTQLQKQVVQATAEQIRLAQMIYDKNDADFEDKVKQLMEVTGKNQDECIVALHDCNGDVNRAINILLEGSSDTTSWETVGGKKKSLGKESSENKENREKRGDREVSRGRGSSNRRGRGGSRGREFRAEENGMDNSQGDRPSDRGKRGRGRGFGRGRGRGAGRFSDQVMGIFNPADYKASSATDGFGAKSEIWETGQNDAHDGIGAWKNSIEEWTAEDWNEDLSETKVFTASSVPAENHMIPGQSINLVTLLQKPVTSTQEAEGNSFEAPQQQTFGQALVFTNSQHSTQVSSGTGNSSAVNSYSPPRLSAVLCSGFGELGSSKLANSTGSQILDQLKSPGLGQFTSQQNNSSSATTTTTTTSSWDLKTPITQSSVLSQFDFKSQPEPSPVLSQLTQRQQQQTQAVPVPPPGLESFSSQVKLRETSPVDTSTAVSKMLQLPTISMGNQAVTAHQIQQKQIKPPKRRITPASKIPASAVEMPGSADVTELNVQFGALEFGSEPALPEFGSTSSSENTSQGTNNSLYSKSVKYMSPPTQPLPSPLPVCPAHPKALAQEQLPPMTRLLCIVGQCTKAPWLCLNQCLLQLRTGTAVLEHRQLLTPSLLQDEQEQLSQPVLIWKVLQPSDHLHGPPLDLFQEFHILLTLRIPELDTVIQMRSNKRRIEGQNHFPQPAGHTSFDADQDTVGLLGSTLSVSMPKTETSPSLPSAGSLPTVISTTASLLPSSSQHVTTLPSLTQSSDLASSSLSQLSSSHQSSLSPASVLSSTASHAHASVENTTSLQPSTTFSTASTSATSTTSSVVSMASNMNTTNSLGLSVTSVSIPAATTRAAPLVSSGKAPPNLPQGVPPLLHNQYIVGPGGLLPAYPQIYGYDDLQMLQSRLPMDYYGITFPAPATLTGRDGNLANNPYSGDITKFGRGDSASPAPATTLAQPQQNQTQTHHTTQQPFLNPTLPPGYSYTGLPYYAGVPGVPSAFQYGPTMFVPPASAKQHGVNLNTASTPFQQASGYGQHGYGAGYDDLTQGTAAGDYSKGGYSGSSQAQNKSAGTGPGKGVSVTSSNTGVPDISGSVYNKTQGGSSQRNQPSTMQQKSQATKTAYGTSPYWTN
ncbi:ubiquitin-associated protein 2-like isoform X2 [Phaenicophaeus curvirostris]|uniref:ubiquitin-associated protein 2-like isoform X2 n=1 Tax=Phaenicophaeus curvirostris TaxID=33595 RepID=UPI0037F0D279